MTNKVTLSTDKYDIIDSGVIFTNGLDPVLMKVKISNAGEITLGIIFHKEKSKTGQAGDLEIIDENHANLHFFDVLNRNIGSDKPCPIISINNRTLYLHLWIPLNSSNDLLLFYTWYLSKEVANNGV